MTTMQRHVLSEEARLQVAVVAGATERANRPRFLLVLGAVLLAAALVYAGVQAQALGSARAGVRREEEKVRRIDALVAELRAAHAAQQLDALPPDPLTTNKLENLGKSLGLPQSLRITEQGVSAGAPGFTKRTYKTSFNTSDVGYVLEWLVQATGENTVGLTGIEVNQIRLRPQHRNNAGWNVEVILTRIERGS